MIAIALLFLVSGTAFMLLGPALLRRSRLRLTATGSDARWASGYTALVVGLLGVGGLVNLLL